MRDYSIVSAKFWIGETGKNLRGNKDAQILALYLLTSPHASMSGLYYCPIYYMVQDTGLPLEGVKKALAGLEKQGFCEYDEASDIVLINQMARFQIGPTLSRGDKRRIGLLKELGRLPQTKLTRRFYEIYCDAYTLKEEDLHMAHGSTCGGPPKLLRSQDQDQDHEQEPKEKGPLALALSGPVHNPLEDLDERQLEAFRALQHIKFRTTTLGPVTADKVVKDVIGLARNLGGDAFPAVASVKQQLSMAAAYLDANPKKAKTPDGLARFLMTWFKNEQNTPHGGGYSRQPWRGGSNEVEPTPRKRVDLTEVVAKLSEGLDRE